MATKYKDEVNSSDQKKINEFGRVNLRFHEFQSELAAKRNELTKVDDAMDELGIADDDVPVQYMLGESYIFMEKDHAENELEGYQKKLMEDVEIIEEKSEMLKARMAVLKVELYDKFGTAINLEE